MIMNKISTFKPKASYPEQAIVMIFDLERFSKFFSQPDVQEYVPKYLNIILEAVDIVINGGNAYWLEGDEQYEELSKPLPQHIHSKFLGDGGLYIWRYNDFTHQQIIILINRLFNLKLKFKKILERASEVIPVMDMPKNIRFGISAGSVYKLNYTNTRSEEFIGYSINLASRLQSYCRDIGFIFSGRLNVKSTELEKNHYTKKIAVKIKGFPKEYVIVDTYDYENLNAETQEELFEDV